MKEKNIVVRAIIEVLGKPKEYVEETIKKYVEEIEKDKNYLLVEKYFAEPKKRENLYSIFAEIEFKIASLADLIGFCFDYMPSSIEILEPEKLNIAAVDATALLNDLQAKLHTFNMSLKALQSENKFIKQSFIKLAENLILVLLAKKEMDIEELSKFSGLPREELKKIADKLVEEGKIKKDKEIYSLK